jgi:magnesium chelatase family protein
LLDRIDLFLEVPKLPTHDLTNHLEAEPSSIIRERVEQARRIQRERLVTTKLQTNAEMTSEQVRRTITLTSEAQVLLKHAIERYQLSGRSYFRLLKVGQTIADLANQKEVQAEHIAEALSYQAGVDPSPAPRTPYPRPTTQSLRRATPSHVCGRGVSRCST